MVPTSRLGWLVQGLAHRHPTLNEGIAEHDEVHVQRAVDPARQLSTARGVRPLELRVPAADVECVAALEGRPPSGPSVAVSFFPPDPL